MRIIFLSAVAAIILYGANPEISSADSPPASAANVLQMNMKELPLDSASPPHTIKFKIRTEGRCTFADHDAYALEMAWSKDKTALLTLEPIAPQDKSFEPVVQKVGDADFLAGFATSLKLPEVEHATPVGVFLCRDTAHEGHCNGKLAIDFKTILSRYKKGNRAQVLSSSPEDKVYFFQYFILDRNKLYTSERYFVKRGYELLQQYLATQSGDELLAKKTVDAIQKYENALGSEAFKVDVANVGLTAFLPRLDSEKCGSK